MLRGVRTAALTFVSDLYGGFILLLPRTRQYSAGGIEYAAVARSMLQRRCARE